MFGVKCRESYRAGKARLYDTTGAERFADARTPGYANARVFQATYSGFELVPLAQTHVEHYEASEIFFESGFREI